MIGLIADTHENVPKTKKAVEFFKEKNVEMVIHLGDVIAPPTAKLFEGLNVKFVEGNNDHFLSTKPEFFKSFGAEFCGELLEFEHKGKKICAFHGTDKEKLKELIESGKYDYVFTGHRHEPMDEKVGNTRVIRPGGFYLGNPEEWNQIVLLDVENDKAEFIKI